MEFRHLGKSGLKVSAVSYGIGSRTVRSWRLTRRRPASEPLSTPAPLPSIPPMCTQMDEPRPSSAPPWPVSPATGLRSVPRCTFRPARVRMTGLSRKHIHEAINASLQRLKTDYVDLYQAHRYDYATPLTETMEAFADVVRAGKALYIGVSEWTAEQLREAHALAADLRISLVSNQPRYNALYRIIEAEVVPTCQELGISQVVFSPMEQGILSGKYRPGEPPPAGSRATHESEGARFVRRVLRDDVLTCVQHLAPLAQAENLTMAQLAVAWVLQNDNVASAITGGSRPDQVTSNAAVAGRKLSPETMAGIDSALSSVIETDHAMVGATSPKQRLR
jgi:aryl-alcohol dehydrogenase-like predicted oxidoreductase